MGEQRGGGENSFQKVIPRDLTMMMKMKPLPTIRPSTTERHHQSKPPPNITL